MNPRNRRMFRPKNAGKQAAGILASSPQLMQSVQKRYLGGNVRTRNTMLPDAAIDQTFMRPPMNLQQAAARPGSLGVRSRNTMLPDAAIDQTFMRPPVTSQQAATTPFSFLTPKGSQAVSNIGTGIGRAFSSLGTFIGTGSPRQIRAQAELEAQGGIGFEDVPDKGTFGAELYRPGTLSSLTELDIADADDAAKIITDADLEDADTGVLPSEQLATSAVSGSGAPTDEAPTTDQGTSETGGTAKQTGNGASVVEQATAKMQANIASVDENTTPKEKLTSDQATNPEVITMFTLFEADRKSPDEVDLNKVAQDARDLMGFDPEKASKRKKEAFYMGLMQAGLAMAAGGSSNAMTNIAKGLSFGLNEYAKDIDQLNEEERENLKEFRDLKVQMIRDEKSYNLAEAGAENTWRQNNATIKNEYRRAKYNAEVAQDQARIAQLNREEDVRLRESEIAWTKTGVMNSMIKDLALLDLKDQELTEQRIKNAADDAWRNRPEEQIRTALDMGWIEADPDNEGKYRTTDEGINVAVEQFLMGKTSAAKTPTDTQQLADSIQSEYNINSDLANIIANRVKANKDLTVKEAFKDATGFDMPDQNQQPDVGANTVVVSPEDLVQSGG